MGKQLRSAARAGGFGTGADHRAGRGRRRHRHRARTSLPGRQEAASLKSPVELVTDATPRTGGRSPGPEAARRDREEAFGRRSPEPGGKPPAGRRNEWPRDGTRTRAPAELARDASNRPGRRGGGAKRFVSRAIRRLNVLETIIMGAAVVIALVGGWLGALLAYNSAFGLPLRTTWMVLSVLLFVVPAALAWTMERRRPPRGRAEKADADALRQPTDGPEATTAE